METKPAFGTSGLRGLVSDFSDVLISDYVSAFISTCPNEGVIHIGQDLRPSSPRIARAVAAAVQSAGLRAILHGALPTPALAFTSIAEGHAAVMVTGSHIPADRNGLKFYQPNGEISKEDEQRIQAALGGSAKRVARDGSIESSTTALPAYVQRYETAFGDHALEGVRVGVYEHSSVAREVLHDVLRALGAETISLGRSDSFVPVDTEAIAPSARERFHAWVEKHRLDALVSTDGDGDRPMLAGGSGEVIAGDRLGPAAAAILGVQKIVTPVSSNNLVSRMGDFLEVKYTRVGSPFVIAGMEKLLRADPTASVAGYEANGGFILGSAVRGPSGPLLPLWTRDSLLPVVAVLSAARAKKMSLDELIAGLPPVFTASDKIENIPREVSGNFITRLAMNDADRASFFADAGAEAKIDLTDGLRVTFTNGAVIHLRSSGNAPECRCYIEAGSRQAASDILDVYLQKLRAELDADGMGS